ncbi:WhiB family transcriptional regulator [Streptomyces sp. TX20-6-3]|uniref:WhiB family transcriptional regulator n=1 Tax=Streptomyces sp. TX20-6-3 TaxID=3028705 RepID=UPI0029B882BF|nr:WhiB family transcriptional regulator [Streptomyces sp. TX20-6-3]MDX2565010.1 WhiB family transcriptional regulator [Streptomyces sp. TX20-6-3]
MSRTHPTDPSPDPRFPFPHTSAPTRCRTRPELYDLASGDLSGDTKNAAQTRLEQARRACSACPIVTACLRWALVNKTLTQDGVFAGTTPAQRRALRRRLADRLGPDWVDVLAARDQARRERAEAARHTPLPVAQARIVHLDRELNGPLRLLPQLTAEEQRLNRSRLVAGLKAA